MTDVKYAMNFRILEELLREAGGTGRSFHDLLNSLENVIPTYNMCVLRKIATYRNAMMHEGSKKAHLDEETESLLMSVFSISRLEELFWTEFDDKIAGQWIDAINLLNRSTNYHEKYLLGHIQHLIGPKDLCENIK